MTDLKTTLSGLGAAVLLAFAHLYQTGTISVETTIVCIAVALIGFFAADKGKVGETVRSVLPVAKEVADIAAKETSSPVVSSAAKIIDSATDNAANIQAAPAVTTRALADTAPTAPGETTTPPTI